MVELWDELNILKSKHAQLYTGIVALQSKLQAIKKSDAEDEVQNRCFIVEYYELCAKWNRRMIGQDRCEKTEKSRGGINA